MRMANTVDEFSGHYQLLLFDVYRRAVSNDVKKKNNKSYPTAVVSSNNKIGRYIKRYNRIFSSVNSLNKRYANIV